MRQVRTNAVCNRCFLGDQFVLLCCRAGKKEGNQPGQEYVSASVNLATSPGFSQIWSASQENCVKTLVAASQKGQTTVWRN